MDWWVGVDTEPGAAGGARERELDVAGGVAQLGEPGEERRRERDLVGGGRLVAGEQRSPRQVGAFVDVELDPFPFGGDDEDLPVEVSAILLDDLAHHPAPHRCP